MLYVIAGEGTGNVKEIDATLADLKEKAATDDVDFWFILHGKEEPTKTDKQILAWLQKGKVYFEVITQEVTYDGAQETTQADDVYAAMLERLTSTAATGESVALLALPVDPDGQDDADEDLLGFIQDAIDGDVEVFQLNSQMSKVVLADEEDEDGDEAPAPAPAKKAAAKKAAAPAAAPAKKAAKKVAAETEDEEEPVAETETEAEEEEPVGPLTMADLSKMNLPELIGLAKGQGIDTKGLSRKDLITAICDEVSVEGPTEEEPAPAAAARKSSPRKSAAATKTAAASNGNGDGEVAEGYALVAVHVGNRIMTATVPVAEAVAFVVR